jgi:hypothetical protein
LARTTNLFWWFSNGDGLGLIGLILFICIPV